MHGHGAILYYYGCISENSAKYLDFFLSPNLVSMHFGASVVFVSLKLELVTNI
jgi:hypothetical protein